MKWSHFIKSRHHSCLGVNCLRSLRLQDGWIWIVMFPCPLCVVWFSDSKMPRRRKTAASSASRRPRARLPDGDQGKNLSREQKLEKLQVLLKDFDAQGKGCYHNGTSVRVCLSMVTAFNLFSVCFILVPARIKQMEGEAANHLQQIEHLTRMELLRTPKVTIPLLLIV